MLPPSVVEYEARAFVLETPIEVSTAQLKAFQDVIHDNARPAQAMKGRVLIRNEVAAEAPVKSE